MPTTVYALPNGKVAKSDKVTAADWNAFIDRMEEFFVQLGELIPQGIFLSTDFNATDSGGLNVSISAGTGWFGATDTKKLEQVTSAQTHTLPNNTNPVYIWIKTDGTPFSSGNVLDQPTGSHLTSTAVTSGGTISSINNNPTGRKNIANIIVAGGHNAFTADQSMGGFKLTNVATPTAAGDASTKGYVDGVAQGLDIKDAVRAATTVNITLSGTQTVDGVSLIAGDRCLVKDQTTGSENGIYVVASGAWTRATDADVSAEVTANIYVWVSEGTANADTGWVLTTNNPITLGTTALVFVQFNGAGSITAGNGLTKTGNTLDVNVDASTIEINADTLRIKDLGVTGAKLADAVQDEIPDVIISVGAESANVIQVGVQFRDIQDNNLAQRMGAMAWLSDSANSAETATAPSGTWSMSAGYKLADEVTNKRCFFMTDAAGLFRIDINEAGVATWFLNVKVGSRIYVSGAITFA